MDNLDKQKRLLNKIVANRNKVQVYDRSSKSSRMVPRGTSKIRSANSKKKHDGSFIQKKKKGGCGGCNRTKKSNG